MSHIGKQKILLGKNLSVICHGWKLSAKGRYGEFTFKFPSHTQLALKNNYLVISNTHMSPALYGSLQRKIKGILYGLSYLYVVNLQIIGVGYRATLESNQIILRLGFSHDITLDVPPSLKVSVFKRNNLKIIGSSLEQVKQFAFKLRSYRRPEPFKGKGLVFLGEKVRRKEGKKKKI